MDEEEDDDHYEIEHRVSSWRRWGHVYKARCLRTGDLVTINRVRSNPEGDGVPEAVLREITLLNNAEVHANVVRLHEVFCSRGYFNLVFECLDMDLRKYLHKHGPLKGTPLQAAAFQCVRGVDHCHRHGILHRDLKPDNVWVDVKTMRLVLADFQLARSFSAPPKVYTHEVVTLWYRAPEILLGQECYGPPVDIWSLGCIFPTMATGEALFPGDSEIDTIFKIFRLLGTPDEDTWPGVSTLRDWSTRFPKWQDTDFAHVRSVAGRDFGGAGIDLTRECLKYNPAGRPSAKALLRHNFFEGVDRNLHL